MKAYMRNRETNGNGYFWNAFAGLVNAGESVILLMVVTRITGLPDAGMLTIAFAVGNLMMTIGKFGVRSYQSTDVKEYFSFSDYFWTRCVTVGLMIVCSLAYMYFCVLEKGYDSKKVTVILSVCFIYAVESLEDVFWGFYQQKMVLDLGAKVFILRWMGILSVFILLLLIRKNLQLSAVCSALAGMTVFAVWNARVFRSFQEKITFIRADAVRRIVRQCFPLCISSFLSFYVINASRYAIDRHLPKEVQACFGFIAMPVFVIQLLNGFLYQPSLVQMSMEWNGGRMRSFRRRAVGQCMAAAVLTLVCLLGAYVCGIPVLSAMYDTDLKDYKLELLVLLTGGGMLAFAGYFNVLLTIMRKQESMMYGYGAAAFLAFLFMNRVVKTYGVMGAAVFQTLLLMVLAVYFGWLCVRAQIPEQ